MKRITEWCETKQELQFAFDQIEKYDEGVVVFRTRKDGKVCLCRTDNFRIITKE